MTLRHRRIREILYEKQGGRCNAPCENYARGLGILLSIRLLELDPVKYKDHDGIRNRPGPLHTR